MADDFDPLGVGDSKPTKAINTSSDFDPLGIGSKSGPSSQPASAPEPSLLNRAIQPLYQATSAIGDLMGSKTISDVGQAGEEYLKENPDYLGKEQLKEAAVALPAGLIKGTVYGIPSMVAGASQFAGIAPETSKAVKDWAEENLNSGIGQSKNPMTQFLYETGQMIGPSIGPNLAVNAVARGLKIGEKAAEWIAAASTGALFGGQQAQQTKDVALARADQLEKDGDPVAAEIMRQKADGWAPYATGAIEALGETLGSKYLGALLRYNEHAPLTTRNFLKSLGVEIGTEMGQSGGEAGVEKQTGIRPEADPLSEAIGVIGPTALMTALIGAGGKALEHFRPNVGEAFHNLMDADATPEAKATASQIIADQFAKNKPVMAALNNPASQYEAIRNIAESISEFSPARGSVFESWAKALAEKGEQIPIDADMFAAMAKWQYESRKKPSNMMDPADTNLNPGVPVADQEAQKTVQPAQNLTPGGYEGTETDLYQMGHAADDQFDAIPSDTVTLYRGEQGDQGGGAWWTPNIERASSFGGTVSSVEVPRSVFEEGQKRAKEQGSATKGDTVLGNEWDKKSTKAKAVDTSIHLDESVPSNAELENMFKGKEETNVKETSKASAKEAGASTSKASNTNEQQRGKQSVQPNANAAAAKPNVKGADANRANGEVPGTGSSKKEKITVKDLHKLGATAFSSKREMADFHEFMDKNPDATTQDIADRFFYNSKMGQGDTRLAVAALKERGYVKPASSWADKKGGRWVRSKELLSKREELAKSKTDYLEKSTTQYSAKIVKPTEKPDVVAMRGNYGKAHMNNTEPGKAGWLGNPVTWQDMKGKVQQDAAKEARETGKKMWETNTFREWASTEFGRLLDEKAKSDPKFREELLKLQDKKIGYYKPEERNHAQEIVKWLNKNAPKETPAVRGEGIDIGAKFPKDQTKSRLATKMIGFGEPGTSTRKYADNWGEHANSGKYSPEDIVFISVNGKGRANLQQNIEKTKAEIDKAIEAGVKGFVADNETNANSSHNKVGEGVIRDYLLSKGLTYKEDGVIGKYYLPKEEVKTFSKEGINISSNEKGIGAALTNPTVLAKRKGNISKDYPITYKGVTYPDVETTYQKLKGPYLKNKTTDQLMTELVTQKLREHPELVDEINKRGGLDFLKKSTHIVKGDNFWESGEGKSDAFMTSLKRAYRTVSKEIEERKQMGRAMDIAKKLNEGPEIETVAAPTKEEKLQEELLERDTDKFFKEEFGLDAKALLAELRAIPVKDRTDEQKNTIYFLVSRWKILAEAKKYANNEKADTTDTLRDLVHEGMAAIFTEDGRKAMAKAYLKATNNKKADEFMADTAGLIAKGAIKDAYLRGRGRIQGLNSYRDLAKFMEASEMLGSRNSTIEEVANHAGLTVGRVREIFSLNSELTDLDTEVSGEEDSLWGKKTLKEVLPDNDEEKFSNFVDRHDVRSTLMVLSTMSPAEQALIIARFGVDPNRMAYEGEMSKENPDTFVITEKFPEMKTFSDIASMHITEGNYVYDTAEKVEWAIKRALFKMGEVNPMWEALRANPALIPFENTGVLPNFLQEKMKPTKTVVTTNEKGENILKEEPIPNRHKIAYPTLPILGYLFDLKKMAALARRGSWGSDDLPYYNQTLVKEWEEEYERWKEAGEIPHDAWSRFLASQIFRTEEEQIARTKEKADVTAKVGNMTEEEKKAQDDAEQARKELTSAQLVSTANELIELGDILDSYTIAGFDFGDRLTPGQTEDRNGFTLSLSYDGKTIPNAEFTLEDGYTDTEYIDTLYKAVIAAESYLSSSIAFGKGKAFTQKPSSMSRNYSVYKIVTRNGKPERLLVSSGWDSLQEAQKATGVAPGKTVTEIRRKAAPAALGNEGKIIRDSFRTVDEEETVRYIYQKESVSKSIKDITKKQKFQQRMAKYRAAKLKERPDVAGKMTHIIDEMEKLAKENKDITSRELAIALQSMVASRGLSAYTEVTRNILNTLSQSLPTIRPESKNIMLAANLAADYEAAKSIWMDKFMTFNARNSDIPGFDTAENVFNIKSPLGYSYAYARMSGLDPKAIVGLYIHGAMFDEGVTEGSIAEAMSFANTYVERMDSLVNFKGTRQAFADSFYYYDNAPMTKKLREALSKASKTDIPSAIENALAKNIKIPGLTTARLDAEGFVGIAHVIAEYSEGFSPSEAEEAVKQRETEAFQEKLTIKDLKARGEDFHPEDFLPTHEILNVLLKGQNPRDYLSPELSAAVDVWKENIIAEAIAQKASIQDVARYILLGEKIGEASEGRVLKALASMGYKDAFVANMAKMELVKRLLDTQIDTAMPTKEEVVDKQINQEMERIQRSLNKKTKSLKLNRHQVRAINRAASRQEILENVADMEAIRRIVAQYYEPIEKEHKDPRLENLDRYSAIAQALSEAGYVPKPAAVAFLQHIQSWLTRNTGGAFTVGFSSLETETARINAMSEAEKEAFIADQQLDKNTKKLIIGGATSMVSIPDVIGMIRLNNQIEQGQIESTAVHELEHAIERIMEFLSLGHKDPVIRRQLDLALANLRSMAPTSEGRARLIEKWMAEFKGEKNPLMKPEKKTFLTVLFSFFKHIGSFFSKAITGLNVDQLLLLSRMKTFSEDQMFESITNGKIGDLIKVLMVDGARIDAAELKDIMTTNKGKKIEFSALDAEKEEFAKAIGSPVTGKIEGFDEEDVAYVDYGDGKIAYDKQSGMALNPNDQATLDKIFGIDDADFSLAASMRNWGDTLRDKILTAKEWFKEVKPYIFESTAADRALYGYDSEMKVEMDRNHWRAQKVRERIKELAGDKRFVGLATKELEAILTYHNEFTVGLAGYEQSFWRIYEADRRDYLSGDPNRMRDASWLNRRRIKILDRVLEIKRQTETDARFREKVDRLMHDINGIYDQIGRVLQANDLLGENLIQGYLARQVISKERLDDKEKVERKKILAMTDRTDRLRSASASRLGGFTQSTPHQNRRFYENIYEMWRDGMELEHESIVENLAGYMDRGTRALAGRVFLDRLLGRQRDGSIRRVTAYMATDDVPTRRMPLATIEQGLTDSLGNPYKALESKSLMTWVNRYESVGPIEDQMMLRLRATSENWRIKETSPGNWAAQERLPVYFHPEIYDRLRSYMSKNALADNKPITYFARLSSGIKRTILSSSAFHYFAFLREYILSNPALGFSATNKNIRDFMQGINVRNPKQAYAQGFDIWDKAMKDLWDLSPYGGGVRTQTLNATQWRMVEIVKDLMRNGATFGSVEDWSERRLGEQENIKIDLDKIGAPTKMREFIKSVGDANEHLLFQRVGVGLKVLSGIASYRLIELDAQKRGATLNSDQIASIAAEQMNAIYGGLNYSKYRLHKSPLVRAFFNPTVQFLLKMTFLAPDWTMSNLTVMKKMFTKNLPGAEKMLYRRWALIMGVRLASMLVLSNLMVHSLAVLFGGDDEDKDLLKRLKKQWDSKEGIAAKSLNMLKVDVTPMAKLLPDSVTGGNLQDVNKYYNIIGHFGDPFKAALEPYTFMKNKLGPIPRFFMDAFYGTNFKGETFTSLGEMLGVDYEKGTYENRSGMHKPGDPKYGKLAGKLTKFGPSAPVSIEQMPSFFLNEFKQTRPIWFQELLNMGMGYTHFFEFVPRILGQQVMSDYVPDETADPEKYVNMMKRKLRSDWEKTVYKAAVSGEPVDSEDRADMYRRMARINMKAKEHGISPIDKESLRKKEKAILRHPTPNMDNYAGD